MKRFVIAAATLLAMSMPAFADMPLSEEEMKGATAAAAAVGCEGGKWEKETDGAAVFELDDAKCKCGSYDLKFDKDFKLLNMHSD